MRSLGCCLAGLLLTLPPAMASPLDGEWTVRFQGQGGGVREAQLSLKGGQGSWRVHGKSKADAKNPCIGQDWAASVEALPDGAQRLQADGRKVADFCGQIDLRLQARADGGWVGEWQGAPLHVERRR